MSETKDTRYKVLARKYRPETFADLVGQDIMVRTLENAFKAGRIAQAFMMTGIRGTGKTTTARIIAKGMNCIGPDGQGGPTIEPCGECEHCRSIMEGRHVDVMEIDAASHTGVENIREVIIDSISYAPSSARYKIFIIDEVHMLSPNAFNALLKTLEEPPGHVKFIFATTEIRKVPVTVLSRCQRFDLRRIEPEVMIALLRRIAQSEGAAITHEALALIARAAEGSARDATSLLDQAISQGAGETTAEQVRTMLGLADRGRGLDLFDMIMRGDAAGALSELSAQYAEGADPLAMLRDLAEITHWISVTKITPETEQDPTIGPDERVRGQMMAKALPMRVLTRMWQMLLKALDEVAQAPNAMMAAEMAVIRLTHVSDLPTPEDLVRKLHDSTPGGARPASAAQQNSQQARAAQPQATSTGLPHPGLSGPVASGTAQVALQQDPLTTLARYATFENVLDIIRTNRDVKLLIEVETYMRLAAYQPGRIEFTPTENAPADLAQRLGNALQRWTGNRWAVTLVNSATTPTILEARNAEQEALKIAAKEHPLFEAVMTSFPNARIKTIRTSRHRTPQMDEDTLSDVEEDWDPFEEEK